MVVNIGWKGDLQAKKFADENAAVEWIRKNFKNITHINFHSTLMNHAFGIPMSHFEIIDALRDKG